MIALKEVIPAFHPYSSEYDKTTWSYYVNHYSDINTQKRDSKMTYEMADGTRYIGLNPPSGAKPLGILYPRASTLGGCSRHNAMITMYAYDSDWSNIASITGDNSWAAEQMRKRFQSIENNQYLPNGIPGHGFKGWLTTSLTSLKFVLQDVQVYNLVLSGTPEATKSSASCGLLGGLTNLVGTVVNTVAGLGKLLILGTSFHGFGPLNFLLYFR